MKYISKTSFVEGKNCGRAFWLKANRPELFAPSDNARTDTGHEVGDLAKPYFGDYAEIEMTGDFEAMARETERLMRSGCANICEATFIANGMLCMVDILHAGADGGWDVVEVKSTTKVKDRHVADLSFQRLVLAECGVDVRRCILMHVDSEYVREGDLDLGGFFALEDLTDDLEAPEDVRGLVAELRETAGCADEPGTAIGCHCTSPHECGFKGHCWKHVPENSVFDVAGMSAKRAFAFIERGWASYGDIYADEEAMAKLNPRQRNQLTAWAVGSDYKSVSMPHVKEFLGTLSHPLYFLDFETFQPVIPLWDGTRPYQQIPSQYSLHWIEEEGGELRHAEFLAKEGEDPRRALAEALVRDIPQGACTLAYNMGFEKGVIAKLAEALPDLQEELMGIRDSIKDLMAPFQKGHYYMGAMGGSYSIKYVLPAMFPDDPELDYKGLEGIHNGAEAMDAYLTLHLKEPEEVAVIREQLLRYCELDTFAMVKIWSRLAEEDRE